jgi:hypothetical protein
MLAGARRYATTPVTAASKSQPQGLAAVVLEGNIVPFSVARCKVTSAPDQPGFSHHL